MLKIHSIHSGIPLDKAMDLAAESLQFTLLAADCEFGVADDRCDLLAALCVVKMIDKKGKKYKSLEFNTKRGNELVNLG